ncbi:MAG TPA: sodium:solute symporter [Saprospiraceae bacterium]|nr:sodium:solute symporter [Saprospiraceae bacterium]
MSSLDWIVLISATFLIVAYGIWKTRKNKNIDAYLMGGHTTKWWTVGLSVMATQASAITFLSTPGQAFDDGLRFVQFYFGLPIAMVIICIIFIPRFVGMKVITVYEYLEQRFDLKTRMLAAFLFLIQRGLGTGITIFAPAIILSSIIGWNLNLTIILMGVIVTFYTTVGGTKAVSASHELQMAVMIGGIITAFIITLHSLPQGVGMVDAMYIAGAHGRLNVVDFSLDWNSRYTFWSGITGGTFLALAYFGTDQSQAQRYISGQSVRDGRLGLMFNAFFKIPMQFFILLAGVMVFVFYQFQSSPLFFNSHVEKDMLETTAGPDYTRLQAEWKLEHENRQSIYAPVLSGERTYPDKVLMDASVAKERALRSEAKVLIEKNLPEVESNDKDYVFLRFIMDYLPHGFIGLLITTIIAAGMSATASGLNALGATTTVDIYKRLIRKEASEKHYVIASKSFTVMWGLIAIGFASIGSLFENLIQFVNIIGSIFYGTVLGIFLSAFLIRSMSSNAVFIAALIAQSIVLVCYWTTDIGFLWYNVIGCGGVVIAGLLIDLMLKSTRQKA